jgi:hypothetical protein
MNALLSRLPVTRRFPRIALALSLAATLGAGVSGCKRKESRGVVGIAGSAGAPPSGEPAGAAAAAPTTASAAAQTWADADCQAEPDAEGKQRVGFADVTLEGDGVKEQHTHVAALCGVFYTAATATKRFAAGDGTLFRACLPEGGRLQISSDVALSGPVSTEFTYENYKKTGALIELYRPSVGTYNQRDVPGEDDKLTIAFDWSTVDTGVSVQWPSKKDRLIRVTAHFDCGGPLR